MTKEMQNSMAEKPEPRPGSSDRKPRDTGVGASSVTVREEKNCHGTESAYVGMELVVEGANMTAAYKRVVRNKGSSGIDGMTVEELKPYLTAEWERIKTDLLEDR